VSRSATRTPKPGTPQSGATQPGAPTGQPAALPPGAGPVPAPRVLGQRRIRGGHLGLAVALIAVGGLLAAFAFFSATRTSDFLAVARPVAAGTTLTEADLATVQINDAAGLRPIPSSERGRVVGQRAAVSLVPGTLLTDEQLTDEELVGPGKRQVGVGLKPQRMPARRLNPGDKVQVIAISNQSAAAGSTDPGTGTSVVERYDAIVVGSTPPSTSDNTAIVYLAVADADAPRIATLAAADQIGIILAGVR
jgi:hypothetical protein